MSQLSTIIEQAFEDRANYSATDCPTEIRQAVEGALTGLNNGTLRVAEKSMVSGLFTNGKKSRFTFIQTE